MPRKELIKWVKYLCLRGGWGDGGGVGTPQDRESVVRGKRETPPLPHHWQHSYNFVAVAWAQRSIRCNSTGSYRTGHNKNVTSLQWTREPYWTRYLKSSTTRRHLDSSGSWLKKPFSERRVRIRGGSLCSGHRKVTEMIRSWICSDWRKHIISPSS